MTTTLAERNLFYRRPDLYDQARGEPDDTLSQLLDELVSTHAPGATTLVDFGCGTGYDLEVLSRQYSCTGVDLQPQMVDHAHRARPHLNVRLGDMREARLGLKADIVLCLGSALAYLHGNDDLRAAFATFAAHANPGALLTICTHVAPLLPADLPPPRPGGAPLDDGR